MMEQLLHVLELKHVVLAIVFVTSLVLGIQGLSAGSVKAGSGVFSKAQNPKLYWGVVVFRFSIALVALFLEITFW